MCLWGADDVLLLLNSIFENFIWCIVCFPKSLSRATSVQESNKQIQCSSSGISVWKHNRNVTELTTNQVRLFKALVAEELEPRPGSVEASEAQNDEYPAQLYYTSGVAAILSRHHQQCFINNQYFKYWGSGLAAAED